MRSLLAYSPCVVLLLAAAQPRSLLAQYQKYEGRPVVNIRFEPAEQPLEGSELFEILPLKRDQPLRMSVVRASIERLFATGRYRDIQVDAEPYNGGVIIKFITTNSWFIGDVSVSGDIEHSAQPRPVGQRHPPGTGPAYHSERSGPRRSPGSAACWKATGSI